MSRTFFLPPDARPACPVSTEPYYHGTWGGPVQARSARPMDPPPPPPRRRSWAATQRRLGGAQSRYLTRAHLTQVDGRTKSRLGPANRSKNTQYEQVCRIAACPIRSAHAALPRQVPAVHGGARARTEGKPGACYCRQAPIPDGDAKAKTKLITPATFEHALVARPSSGTTQVASPRGRASSRPRPSSASPASVPAASAAAGCRRLRSWRVSACSQSGFGCVVPRQPPHASERMLESTAMASWR